MTTRTTISQSAAKLGRLLLSCVDMWSKKPQSMGEQLRSEFGRGSFVPAFVLTIAEPRCGHRYQVNTAGVGFGMA